MSIPRLDLDFRTRWRPPLVGTGVLIAGGLMVGALAFLQAHAQREVHRLRAEVLEIAPLPERPAATSKAPLLSIAKQQAVIERLVFRWEEFFAALEAVAPDNVTLLSIAPNTSRGTVQIKGEARDLYAALSYVKALSAGGYFHGAEMTDHELGTQNPALPVRFSVNVRWAQQGGGR